MQIRNCFITLTGVMLFLLPCGYTCAQEAGTTEKFEPSGKVYGKIFTNFNTSLQGSEKQTAFEVRRAYLGYEYLISPQFSAEIKLDIGSPNDAEYSLLRRFGYFKTAAVYYQPLEPIKLTFGLQDAVQFKVQEKFWKRRYIAKPFMDEYDFGPSADIGAKVQLQMDFFDVDVAFFNGEGYSSLQNDDTFKGALGITAYPVKGFVTRIYGDISSKSVNQSTAVLFAGYSNNLFSIGGEYAWHWNREFQDNHDVYGYSVTGDLLILPATRIFARYDKIDSNILNGESVPWNLANDETALTAGIEYIPIKNIRIAANYQDHYPAAKNAELVSAIFLNIEASF
jgi:hypothetical protein